MSKISCEIIKDLLPLYIDDVCSSDSVEAIKDHLTNCPLCEAEYLKLQNDTDIKHKFDNDFEKAVKNANKKIKKDKKKFVIKTISVTTLILIIIGIVSYLIVPIQLAQDEYYNNGYLYAKSNAINIEITNQNKVNSQSRYLSLYINKKHGKYSVDQHEYSDILVFNENKSISIISVPIDEEKMKTFSEQNNWFGFNGSTGNLYFTPLIEKGLKNMGINTDNFYYDFDPYIHLITTQEDFTKVNSPKKFTMWYAYYSLFTTMMPIGNAGYYITLKNENLKGYGWSSLSEEAGTKYIINVQDKKNPLNQVGMLFYGFSKDEMIEIVESIKLI